MTGILFRVQVTARPVNIGDRNNQRYAVQAFAKNSTLLHYPGEGPTVAVAFCQFARTVDERECGPSYKQ